MAGGMTHLDTFDPKPENKEAMGETEAISTLQMNTVRSLVTQDCNTNEACFPDSLY